MARPKYLRAQTKDWRELVKAIPWLEGEWSDAYEWYITKHPEHYRNAFRHADSEIKEILRSHWRQVYSMDWSALKRNPRRRRNPSGGHTEKWLHNLFVGSRNEGEFMRRLLKECGEENLTTGEAQRVHSLLVRWDYAAAIKKLNTYIRNRLAGRGGEER